MPIVIIVSEAEIISKRLQSADGISQDVMRASNCVLCLHTQYLLLHVVPTVHLV